MDIAIGRQALMHGKGQKPRMLARAIVVDGGNGLTLP